MQYELQSQSQARLDDLLEQLGTYYDLEDLTREELLDALLDLAGDLLREEGGPTRIDRSTLIDYCGRKIEARSV